ncbi:MAG: galactonate dehydratase [Chitinophagaceae bacterium]|nr:galactonate dehydratase [Chitinophagaceae bacterium]
MIVEKIELFKLPPRWVFLKIYTNQPGLVGWGEPVIEGRSDTVMAAVKELSSYIIGQPVDNIENIWQTLYRGGFYRGGPILMSAISGIDQALWDIKGKALNRPVYDLLGGAVRNKMKIYGWIGGDKPSNIAEAARKRLDAGFTAVKMNGTAEMEWIDTPQKIQEAVNRAAAVRAEVGPEVGIGIDFHGRVHKGMAKVLAKELEPFKLMFIEEPVLAENNEALKAIQSLVSTPIATGERMFSRWDFKQIFMDGTVDIIQPDLSHAGGITEVKKIAAMAEAYDVALAPHCPLGPISFASALQIDFNAINAFIQESSIGIHYNEGADLLDYLTNAEDFQIKDGYIALLQKPGLGAEINEELVKELSRNPPDWKNPLWYNADGSVTEW